jgi:hemoglobin
LEDRLEAVRSQSAELSEQALSRLVRQFYAKAQHDPLLGPVFDRAVTEWEPHLERVAAFWTTAVLGVPAYRGNPMAAHKKHALTPAMFGRWLQIWEETADEVFAAEPATEIKGRAAAIAESVKLGLFFDPHSAPSAAE